MHAFHAACERAFSTPKEGAKVFLARTKNTAKSSPMLAKLATRAVDRSRMPWATILLPTRRTQAGVTLRAQTEGSVCAHSHPCLGSHAHSLRLCCGVEATQMQAMKRSA